MTSGSNPKRLVLTVGEAGELCRLSRNAMYSAIARGEIPSIRVGRRLLIPKAALERLLSGECDE